MRTSVIIRIEQDDGTTQEHSFEMQPGALVFNQARAHKVVGFNENNEPEMAPDGPVFLTISGPIAHQEPFTKRPVVGLEKAMRRL